MTKDKGREAERQRTRDMETDRHRQRQRQRIACRKKGKEDRQNKKDKGAPRKVGRMKEAEGRRQEKASEKESWVK